MRPHNIFPVLYLRRLSALRWRVLSSGGSSARDMFFHLLKPFVYPGGMERRRVSFLLRLASRRRSLLSSLLGGTRRVTHLVGALQGCRALVCRFFSLGRCTDQLLFGAGVESSRAPAESELHYLPPSLLRSQHLPSCAHG